MAVLRKSPLEISIEDLDRELIVRGAQSNEEKRDKFKDREGSPARDAMLTATKELYKSPPPINHALADLSTREVVKVVIFKTISAMDAYKGEDDNALRDWFDLEKKEICKNSSCIAAVMLKDNLSADKNGFSTLKVKNYGKTFNLCDLEPFREQPVSSGLMFNGFLVKEDVVATTDLPIDESQVTDLRFVFGYRMVDSYTPALQIANDNIYKGAEILHKSSSPEKGNWTLIKLDREVKGQSIAELSEDNIYLDQEVYVIGHPLGLPLKYAPGLFVCDDSHEPCFGADLSVYSGGSGSPVFDAKTHNVIGMVDRDVYSDFRWTGECWVTVIYPEGKNHCCTKASAFRDFIRQL